MVTSRGLRLRADPDRAAIVPGEPAVLTLEVFNATALVDQFELSAVGIDPRWVIFDPPRLPLFPSEAGTAQVTILIDSAYAYTAGNHVIGLRAQSSVDPNLSVVVEVPVDVSATLGATLEVNPSITRAGRAGAYLAVVRNLSNTTLEVDMRGTDPESAMGFEFTPEHLTVQPGDEAWAVVQARGGRPLKGSDTARVFSVLGVLPDPDTPPLQAEATLLQKPWLPAITDQVIMTLLLGVVLLGAFLLGSKLTEPPPPETAAAGATGPAVAAGALSSLSATLERPNAGAAGVFTITFALGSALPAGGGINVTFPEGYTLNAGGATQLTKTDGLGFDGPVRQQVDGRTLSIVRLGSGTPTKAGTTIALPIAAIGNPRVSGPAGEVKVVTVDAKGAPLDAGVVPPVAIAPGTLRDAVVGLAPLGAGAASTATLSIALGNDLPPDGSIHVTFPEGFVTKGAVLDAANQSFTPPLGETLSKGGTLKVKVDDKGVGILRNNDGEVFKARTTMLITLTGIKNAGVSGPTGVFTIETRNGAGVVIDTGTAPGISLSGGALSSLIATLENPRAGGTGSVTLLLTLPGEIPANARFEVKFPAGFALNEGGPTTVAKGAIAGTDGTAAAIVLDRTVTVLRNNDGKTAPAGTAIAITLTNVKNPPSGPAPAIAIQVSDGTGRLIADGDTGAIAIAP